MFILSVVFGASVFIKITLKGTYKQQKSQLPKRENYFRPFPYAPSISKYKAKF
jgi:hypothetical protein